MVSPVNLCSTKINNISNSEECYVLFEVIIYPADSWKYEIEIHLIGSLSRFESYR